MLSVDDLVLVLHHHWILDDSTFADERQRVQLAMLLLLAGYTGQRPCSILETTRRSKTYLSSDATQDEGDDEHEEIAKDVPQIQAEESDTYMEEDAHEYPTSDAEEQYRDVRSLPRGLLYKDVRMRVLQNDTSAEHNPLVMEVTFTHTKGEDNKPQP